MARAIGCEAQVKCSVDMFYGFFKNNITQLVDCFPETYKSIQVIDQGETPSVGSVRLWKYQLGDHFITTKEEMIDVDGETKSITWNFLDGDVMNLYRSFQIKLVFVTPTGEGSCVAKWSVEYENAVGDLPYPTAFMNLLRMISVELPPKLLKQA
ncbi:hypothetical protein MKW94_030954 [Papaver nudicaule]|uniref:Bet v I/Major latex protein domain-containing protein n=1 Tax=Papaver nudicaule TaxID=74823 RepID=A0AA41VHI6_PAPNU|nr:hypothetical protein [Papaver nudicaule]